MAETVGSKVIGQEEAIKKLTRAIQRTRAGLKDPKKPIGSFIFLGPTGVGKTELAKELSRFMFGSYVVLVGVWWVAVGRFGMIGIIVAWLVVEVVQMLYIMRLNTRFFAHHEELDTKYPLRLAVLCSVALVASLRVLPYTALLPLVTQIALAVGVGALLSAIVIPVFNLAPIWGTVRGRVMTKLGRAQ